MKCSKCGSRDIDFSESSGQSICVNCGTVLEEDAIVSSIEFQETGERSHVIGQFVSASASKPYSGGARRMGRYSDSRDSRDSTLLNARRAIAQLAGSLQLGNKQGNFVEQACRLYQLALQRNFTFGRKQANVVATCLYIICRKEKSPHLLIDFSDLLQVNVYILGRTFLQFSRLLSSTRLLNGVLPVVDPSLYLHRYASRLDFGDNDNNNSSGIIGGGGSISGSVVATALRIITRLKKDWISEGRRPDGVCALALLVAARAHDFEVSQQVICDLFRISQTMLHERIVEFTALPTAYLNLQQFHAMDAAADSSYGCEHDPPSYIRNVLKTAAAAAVTDVATTAADDVAAVDASASASGGMLTTASGKCQLLRVSMPGMVLPQNAQNHRSTAPRFVGKQLQSHVFEQNNNNSSGSNSSSGGNEINLMNLENDAVYATATAAAVSAEDTSEAIEDDCIIAFDSAAAGANSLQATQQHQQLNLKVRQQQHALFNEVAVTSTATSAVTATETPKEVSAAAVVMPAVLFDADGEKQQSTRYRVAIGGVEVDVPLPAIKRKRCGAKHQEKLKKQREMYSSLYEGMLTQSTTNNNNNNNSSNNSSNNNSSGGRSMINEEARTALVKESESVKDNSYVGGWNLLYGKTPTRLREKKIVICVSAAPSVTTAKATIDGSQSYSSGRNSSSSSGRSRRQQQQQQRGAYDPLEVYETAPQQQQQEDSSGSSGGSDYEGEFDSEASADEATTTVATAGVAADSSSSSSSRRAPKSETTTAAAATAAFVVESDGTADSDLGELIPEEEVHRYILSEDEQLKRKTLWEKTYGSFMLQRQQRQQEREREAAQRGRQQHDDRFTRTGRLKKKYANNNSSSNSNSNSSAAAAAVTATAASFRHAPGPGFAGVVGHGTAAAAAAAVAHNTTAAATAVGTSHSSQLQASVRSVRTISKKINYDVLKGVFSSDTDSATSTTAATTNAAVGTADTISAAVTGGAVDNISRQVVSAAAFSNARSSALRPKLSAAIRPIAVTTAAATSTNSTAVSSVNMRVPLRTPLQVQQQQQQQQLQQQQQQQQQQHGKIKSGSNTAPTAAAATAGSSALINRSGQLSVSSTATSAPANGTATTNTNNSAAVGLIDDDDYYDEDVLLYDQGIGGTGVAYDEYEEYDDEYY